jgi:Domain of unknown function (DUF4301)
MWKTVCKNLNLNPKPQTYPNLMFSDQDKSQITAQGIGLTIIDQQISHFVKGFPYLQIQKAATVGDGIIRVSDDEAAQLASDFDSQAPSLDLLKFVPASGAATRMFKSLFTYIETNKSDFYTSEFEERLDYFAFFNDLKTAMLAKGVDIDMVTTQVTVDYLLNAKGLDYGNLPKGLLQFHGYPDGTRTPVEEHLVEGAKYANSDGKVKIHFTVSPEHLSRFEALIESVKNKYEARFGIVYDISFSEQKPATDTISVNLDNSPFRNVDGSLLFRPAGHGALLANLNDQDTDVVFLKNIDNVVPEKLSETTYTYKKVLAALMLQVRQQLFDFQTRIENGESSASLISDLETFFSNTLCTLPPIGFDGLTDDEKLVYFKQKLDRPVRACGMVKNVGEPGGGPFWAVNADGTTSLQVVESAQVNMGDMEQKKLFEQATHFNPVDVVCSLKGYKGKKFDLMQFRDMNTGFVTKKSKDGKDLKAQELPGLWNGSMADWNTIFVEVPLITFNPVKIVNDLLRDEHQG